MNNPIALKKKAAYISLTIGIGMFAAKFVAYFITGSAAIFSDAAESVVHVLATAIALYSIILSSKPADRTHLYGHGNIEFFSAGIEGMLIVIAAIFIIYQGILDIIKGPVLEQLDIGIVIISGAGVINFLLGSYLVKTGKKTNSLTLIADGKHVLTDSYTSLGVIVGISLVLLTNITLLDPLFAIAVAINILVTGYQLMRKSIGGLMNETDKGILTNLAETLSRNKKSYWIDIHELRYWQSGDRIFIDFHLLLPYYFTIEQSHKEENNIEKFLDEEFPGAQIKIHFDFCVPELCKFCNFTECEVRKSRQSVSFEWNLEKMTGKPIYKIK